MSAPDTLDARQAREVEVLRGLVAIPSLSGQERPAVEYLCGVMTELGLAATIDDAGNAVGTAGDGPSEVVLLGHIDTVPGEIPVRIADGVLHGRGSVDAKGPLATFVCAAGRAVAAGLPGLRLTVIGAVGEESDSAGAYYIVDRYRPAFTIIGEPSSWDRVVLGYKGSMSATYTLRQPGAHSAAPVASGPQVAIDFWNRVTEYAAAFNAGRDAAFDRCEPTLKAFNTTTDGLYEQAHLRMGFRLPLDLDGATLTARLTKLARLDGENQEATAQVEVAEALPAFRSDKSNALVRAFLPAIRAAGGKPAFKVKTGTADMNIVGPAWGCPIVAYGPGDSKLDHTPHEHLPIADFLRAITVLTDVLTGLGSKV
ncbi:MAG TPA: [LysW]-lysine hydrolase [Thermomicrobiales bacterium]|nr:[LysW]-lysine hydrolase [Thermomicrobiales bacterium]